jgi:hypothetical protein
MLWKYPPMTYASNSKPHRTGHVVEGLLSDVFSLSFADLSHFFDKSVGRPEVTAAGWRVSERRLSPRTNAEARCRDDRAER